MDRIVLAEELNIGDEFIHPYAKNATIKRTVTGSHYRSYPVYAQNHFKVDNGGLEIEWKSQNTQGTLVGNAEVIRVPKGAIIRDGEILVDDPEHLYCTDCKRKFVEPPRSERTEDGYVCSNCRSTNHVPALKVVGYYGRKLEKAKRQSFASFV